MKFIEKTKVCNYNKLNNKFCLRNCFVNKTMKVIILIMLSKEKDSDNC